MKEEVNMYEISLDGVKKYMDATLVLKNITFMVTEGEKVGIVGENGSGKTTILKLIAGIETLNHCPGYPYAPTPLGYDEGWVNTPQNATCVYLEQIPQYTDHIKVIDVLNLAFIKVYHIENEMRQLEDSMQYLTGMELERTLTKYSEMVQLYEIKGGYDIKEKLSRVCKGLQFDNNFLNQEFNLLSGGEKTTVSLGKLLIDTSDILLLDEPTNHLDIESVEWLEGYLKSYKGIVIVVSHDRYFLDNVVTKIIEVEDKECDTYKGNYSDYVIQKDEKQRIQYENFREQKKKINAMEQSVKELRDWALKSDNNKFFRRAGSIQIKLNKLEKIEKPVFEKQNMKLNFKTTERSGKITIKAVGLTKSFEYKRNYEADSQGINKIIFKDADLLVQYGERVALIGPNGSGKTTFLKMLLGLDEPDQGAAVLGANVRMAYLPQNIVFENEEFTVLDYFREDISILEGKAREYLAKFMFYGGNVYKKIKHLSGGEKIRLKLSKLLFEDVNLLILDEPTNHLDTASLESLEESLEDFMGTIFFISHDRYFINKVADRVIAIEESAFKNYHGNYEYYKIVKDELCQQKINISIQKREQSEDKNKKTRNVDSSKDPKVDKKEVEAAKIECRVNAMEDEISEIESLMETCGSDLVKVNLLYAEKEELNKKLEMLMEIWLSLNQ
jgi:ATPase subunit of ABC transporter with duplicated ATPase domains